jgi:hypothetical protein
VNGKLIQIKCVTFAHERVFDHDDGRAEIEE